MPFKISDKMKPLPNLEVQSCDAQIMPRQFKWGIEMYDYIGIQYSIYRIQWCFDSTKMFEFKDWDLDFLYALDLTKWRVGMPPSEVSNMLIDMEMPKTWDIVEMRNWEAKQTAFALSKCRII